MNRRRAASLLSFIWTLCLVQCATLVVTAHWHSTEGSPFHHHHEPLGESHEHDAQGEPIGEHSNGSDLGDSCELKARPVGGANLRPEMTDLTGKELLAVHTLKIQFLHSLLLVDDARGLGHQLMLFRSPHSDLEGLLAVLLLSNPPPASFF